MEHSDLPGYGCEATIRYMKHYKALADRDADVAGDMLPDFDRVRDTLHRLGRIRNAEGKLVVDLPDEENRRITRLGDSFGSLVGAHGHFWRFFRTKEGHMGMGGLAVEENDSVRVVSSCPVPLVLRHREDGSYQLIGDSYVHGIMHGEAVKSARWEDVCIT